ERLMAVRLDPFQNIVGVGWGGDSIFVAEWNYSMNTVGVGSQYVPELGQTIFYGSWTPLLGREIYSSGTSEEYYINPFDHGEGTTFGFSFQIQGDTTTLFAGKNLVFTDTTTDLVWRSLPFNDAIYGNYYGVVFPPGGQVDETHYLWDTVT